MYAINVKLNICIFVIFIDWLADDKPENFKDVCITVFPFCFGTVVVAVFFKIGALLLSKTCKMGEIVVVE